MWQSRVEIKHYSVVHYRVWNVVTQNFRQGWGSYTLCKCVKYSWVYTVHMSPTRNRRTVLQRFECGKAIIIHNKIMFNFYLALPHMQYSIAHSMSSNISLLLSNSFHFRGWVQISILWMRRTPVVWHKRVCIWVGVNAEVIVRGERKGQRDKLTHISESLLQVCEEEHL